MDKSSKRDIYDLIAELAKSSNINLDGTEFSPDPIDIRRPSVPQIEPEQNIPQQNPNIFQIEKAFIPESKNTDPNFLELLEQAKTASIEQLNQLKAEALEELNQARAALLNEVNKASNGHNTPDETVNISTRNKNGLSSTNEKLAENPALEQQAINLSEIEKAKLITHEEIALKESSLLEELHRLRSLELNSPKETSVIQEDFNFFESLTIDDLNKITAEAVQENKETLNSNEIKNGFEANASSESIQIQNQLKEISEKIDSINSNALKTEIVEELKLSDARIVEQVNKNSEDLLNNISTKIIDVKQFSRDGLIKWLGYTNLLLLLIVLMYLFIQKFNPSDSRTKKEEPKSEATSESEITNSNIQFRSNQEESSKPTEQNIGSNSQVLPNNTQQVGRKETNAKEVIANTTNSRKYRRTNKTAIQTGSTQITPQNEAVTNDANSKVGSGKNVITQNDVKLANQAKKIEVPARSKTELTKKTPPKEDVFFEED